MLGLAVTILNVTMHPDGTAYVQQRFSEPALWSYEELSTAIAGMQQCCVIRQGLPDNCPCQACEVGKVARAWRRTRAQERGWNDAK